MELGLSGKVALVGGSSRGIGRAIARAFLAEGARVAITGRDQESLAMTEGQLAEEFGEDAVLAISADLTEQEPVDDAVTRAEERFGSIDCLVANIGNALTEETGWDIPAESWEADLASNLGSGVHLARRVIPSMLRSGGGSIVFTNSIAGLESHPAAIPYNAAKAALASYAKNLALRLGPTGIRVNSVAPGNVIFPGATGRVRLMPTPRRCVTCSGAMLPCGASAPPRRSRTWWCSSRRSAAGSSRDQ